MNQNLQDQELDTALEEAPTLSECLIVDVREMHVNTPRGPITHAAGPVLLIQVLPGMLESADAAGGVQMRVGTMSHDGCALLLAFLRAGDYLVVAVLDLGDHDVRRLADDVLLVGEMRIALTNGARDVVSCHALTSDVRDTLETRRPDQPAGLELHAHAVRRTAAIMRESLLLRELGVNSTSIRSRSIAVHLGRGLHGASFPVGAPGANSLH